MGMEEWLLQCALLKRSETRPAAATVYLDVFLMESRYGGDGEACDLALSFRILYHVYHLVAIR